MTGYTPPRTIDDITPQEQVHADRLLEDALPYLRTLAQGYVVNNRLLVEKGDAQSAPAVIGRMYLAHFRRGYAHGYLAALMAFMEHVQQYSVRAARVLTQMTVWFDWRLMDWYTGDALSPPSTPTFGKHDEKAGFGPKRWA